jgi:acetyl esterase/lipase
MNLMSQLFRVLFLLLFLANQLSAQRIIPLYPNEIPNATSTTVDEQVQVSGLDTLAYAQTSVPTLQVYLPKKSNGTAVIIIPGGAYQFLAYKEEGTNIARYFNEQGVTAFVLKYRLPSDAIMKDKTIEPLQDAQQAMKFVRMNAADWHINKIGVIGFSAGGHLASTLGTHFKHNYIPNEEGVSLRPDFMILVYPVISMKESLAHMGSRVNLLGTSPSPEVVSLFSNEEQVTADTPPTYLTHTGDDGLVPVDNSIAFYQALVKNKVQAEMHLYAKGDHGFVLHLPSGDWMGEMDEKKWLCGLNIAYNSNSYFLIEKYSNTIIYKIM